MIAHASSRIHPHLNADFVAFKTNKCSTCTGSSSESEVEFFRLMDYEIRRGAQFLALSEGQYVLKTR